MEEIEQQSKKLFLSVVKELRELISEQNIKPGDKLPSERVLSEQLEVSRSALREALRSLELLGLIESRHGGGTYLKGSQKNQLVEIVASFILQDHQSRKDVEHTRQMYEKEAIRVLCQNEDFSKQPVWNGFFTEVQLDQEISRETILKEMIIISGNRLALKIWMQLMAYSHQAWKNPITAQEKEDVQLLLKAIHFQYEDEAIAAYNTWLKKIEMFF